MEEIEENFENFTDLCEQLESLKLMVANLKERHLSTKDRSATVKTDIKIKQTNTNSLIKDHGKSKELEELETKLTQIQTQNAALQKELNDKKWSAGVDDVEKKIRGWLTKKKSFKKKLKSGGGPSLAGDIADATSELESQIAKILKVFSKSSDKLEKWENDLTAVETRTKQANVIFVSERRKSISLENTDMKELAISLDNLATQLEKKWELAKKRRNATDMQRSISSFDILEMSKLKDIVESGEVEESIVHLKTPFDKWVKKIDQLERWLIQITDIQSQMNQILDVHDLVEIPTFDEEKINREVATWQKREKIVDEISTIFSESKSALDECFAKIDSHMSLVLEELSETKKSKNSAISKVDTEIEILLKKDFEDLKEIWKEVTKKKAEISELNSSLSDFLLVEKDSLAHAEKLEKVENFESKFLLLVKTIEGFNQKVALAMELKGRLRQSILIEEGNITKFSKKKSGDDSKAKHIQKVLFFLEKVQEEYDLQANVNKKILLQLYDLQKVVVGVANSEKVSRTESGEFRRKQKEAKKELEEEIWEIVKQMETQITNSWEKKQQFWFDLVRIDGSITSSLASFDENFSDWEESQGLSVLEDEAKKLRELQKNVIGGIDEISLLKKELKVLDDFILNFMKNNRQIDKDHARSLMNNSNIIKRDMESLIDNLSAVKDAMESKLTAYNLRENNQNKAAIRSMESTLISRYEAIRDDWQDFLLTGKGLAPLLDRNKEDSGVVGLMTTAKKVSKWMWKVKALKQRCTEVVGEFEGLKHLFSESSSYFSSLETLIQQINSALSQMKQKHQTLKLQVKSAQQPSPSKKRSKELKELQEKNRELKKKVEKLENRKLSNYSETEISDLLVEYERLKGHVGELEKALKKKDKQIKISNSQMERWKSEVLDKSEQIERERVRKQDLERNLSMTQKDIQRTKVLDEGFQEKYEDLKRKFEQQEKNYMETKIDLGRTKEEKERITNKYKKQKKKLKDKKKEIADLNISLNSTSRVNDSHDDSLSQSSFLLEKNGIEELVEDRFNKLDRDRKSFKNFKNELEKVQCETNSKTASFEFESDFALNMLPENAEKYLRNKIVRFLIECDKLESWKDNLHAFKSSLQTIDLHSPSSKELLEELDSAKKKWTLINRRQEEAKKMRCQLAQINLLYSSLPDNDECLNIKQQKMREEFRMEVESAIMKLKSFTKLQKNFILECLDSGMGEMVVDSVVLQIKTRDSNKITRDTLQTFKANSLKMKQKAIQRLKIFLLPTEEENHYWKLVQLVDIEKNLRINANLIQQHEQKSAEISFIVSNFKKTHEISLDAFQLVLENLILVDLVEQFMLNKKSDHMEDFQQILSDKEETESELEDLRKSLEDANYKLLNVPDHNDLLEENQALLDQIAQQEAINEEQEMQLQNLKSILQQQQRGKRSPSSSMIVKRNTSTNTAQVEHNSTRKRSVSVDHSVPNLLIPEPEKIKGRRPLTARANLRATTIGGTGRTSPTVGFVESNSVNRHSRSSSSVTSSQKVKPLRSESMKTVKSAKKGNITSQSTSVSTVRKSSAKEKQALYTRRNKSFRQHRRRSRDFNFSTVAGVTNSNNISDPLASSVYARLSRRTSKERPYQKIFKITKKLDPIQNKMADVLDEISTQLDPDEWEAITASTRIIAHSKSIYLINSRKINLKLANERLLVRWAKGWRNFSDFFVKYLKQEISSSESEGMLST